MDNVLGHRARVHRPAVGDACATGRGWRTRSAADDHRARPASEPGTFTGYIGTFPDKFAEVKAGFLKEVNRIRDEAPTKEEVEDAKKYLPGACRSG